MDWASVRTALSASWPSGTWLKATRCSMTSAAVTTKADLPPDAVRPNRDGKRDRPIVVYGVLADSMGRPLAVQAYAGNTGDPTRWLDQVEKIRGRFGPAGGAGGGRPADRDADQPSEASSGTGVDLGPAPPPIRRLVESEAAAIPGLIAIAEVLTPPTLIVCHNPAGRASAAGRLTATEEALARIARQVARDPHALISDGSFRVKNRFQVAKHFRTQIADGSFHYERRTEAIIRGRNWTGSICCGPANRPIVYRRPPWCAATRT